MDDGNVLLKQRVREFWQAHPCGSKFSDSAIGSPEFFARVEAHRYAKEWHIPQAADFGSARGLKVLEVGCGIGTDGLRFAKAGAKYTGVDLTEAAVDLAKKILLRLESTVSSRWPMPSSWIFAMSLSIWFTRTGCCTTRLMSKRPCVKSIAY